MGTLGLRRWQLTLTDDHSSVESYEVLENTLLHCRGILWAHDSLYVCATDSKGFYRLRDTDMEWDVGLPWYRPTRLNHVVSGGEYACRWRV